MYHFLDDSGDPGLSGAVGSSSHFVLAMVELPQRHPLSSLALIRQKLYLSPVYEFKYYKLTLRSCRLARYGFAIRNG